MLSYLESLVEQYKNQENINWDLVKSIENNDIINYSDLSINFDKKILNKVAILKLNGGLGTSMGCNGPKSTIKIKNNLSFLDIICNQIIKMNEKFSTNIPLIFMNSLNTELETKKFCNKYNSSLQIYHFNQNFLPRMDLNFKNLSEKYNDENKELFYPPGHGDIYQALRQSDVFNILEDKGIEYLFISNSDNLGAVFDYKILQFMNQSSKDFIMEVVPKTLADVKGGSLIKYNNNIQLLEVAQVPKNYLNEFYNIEKFKYFNTNNLWIKLSSIKKCNPSMEVIYNPKKLSNGKQIIQLEIAMGSAIKSFKNSTLINVPRNRFRPVKKCQDLFLIQSNLFHLDKYYNLESKSKDLPLIKFSDNYKKIQDFTRAFPQGIPDISNLKSLTLNNFKIFNLNPLDGNIVV